MTKGKLIYVSVQAFKGLEEFGEKCISEDFAKVKYIKYNSAILLLLKFADMGEKIHKEKIKLVNKLGDSEE
jgi:hypothetical protein